MTILYSVISRQTTILVQHSSCTGNFQVVIEQILKQIPPEDSKLTYSQDNYLFHYISEKSIIYMCVTDDEFERSRAFLFLNVIKKRFESMYGDRALKATAYAMSSEFRRILENEMKYYSSNRDVDKVSRIHVQLNELKEIMVKNIDNVIARGERIELLIDKTENLASNSVSFRQSSRTLARTMFWKHIKFYLIIAVITLLVLYVIVSISCGGLAWQSCIH